MARLLGAVPPSDVDFWVVESYTTAVARPETLRPDVEAMVLIAAT
jgi:hypothetical protein